MSKSVLVVEDDPDGQELISRMLFRAKIPVEVTGTAEDALSVLSLDEHAIAVIDLALPKMDGFDLLKQIRGNDSTKTLHCVAVTAFHTPALRQRVMEEGFDGYFAKPIDDRRFLATLTDVYNDITNN
ncbi:MAG: response regulator [Chloroflexota bacterium]